MQDIYYWVISAPWILDFFFIFHGCLIKTYKHNLKKKKPTATELHEDGAQSYAVILRYFPSTTDSDPDAPLRFLLALTGNFSPSLPSQNAQFLFIWNVYLLLCPYPFPFSRSIWSLIWVCFFSLISPFILFVFQREFFMSLVWFHILEISEIAIWMASGMVG